MYGIGMNGIIPLTWLEISSWLTVTERVLQPWEKEAIKKMSEAYCSEYHAATEDPNRNVPYRRDPTKIVGYLAYQLEKDLADDED